MKSFYKTIVISDVHLGTKGSKARELVRFLKQVTCENLILNGDIIDGWQLRKYGKWKKRHTRFFRRVLKMVEEDNTKVTYLRGNHDDFLDQILPMAIGNFSIQREMVYESNGKRYFITHGDIFDSITSNLKWLAKMGDVGYTFLLYINRKYNNYRRKKGLPYYSLSQVVKSKVKGAVAYIDDFESELAKIAKIKNCDGIICGHIHQPAIKEIEGIVYLNSGDWVESLSALVEDEQGEWSLVYYSETEKVAPLALADEDDDAPDEEFTELINPKKLEELSKAGIG
ncbi:MAG TPA: UDP-2,3-diacylglucosamine hydrolase [Cytophagales bacterium]|nr:UDP-2,3-diacylglucosamine hydrolase [Cytophagales bacterium]HAA20249.1 UDP-2,3-diacylglucosamine hydrolase [Cytophagales bacterium]HAP61783.1 UDP-2,3-diacylglucosamine hydrolase [Cytophagales bacterium]